MTAPTRPMEPWVEDQYEMAVKEAAASCAFGELIRPHAPTSPVERFVLPPPWAEAKLTEHVDALSRGGGCGCQHIARGPQVVYLPRWRPLALCQSCYGAQELPPKVRCCACGQWRKVSGVALYRFGHWLTVARLCADCCDETLEETDTSHPERQADA